MGVPFARSFPFDVFSGLAPEDADVPRVRVVDVPNKGRGVIALRAMAVGEVIERAAVVVIPVTQVFDLERTVLEHYVYDWSEGCVAVALGNGSVYNHSYRPNAVYTKDYARGVIVYAALRDIAEGEEILINYNGDPADRAPLWFSVVDDDEP